MCIRAPVILGEKSIFAFTSQIYSSWSDLLKYEISFQLDGINPPNLSTSSNYKDHPFSLRFAIYPSC